jgi:hypothetical protein
MAMRLPSLWQRRPVPPDHRGKTGTSHERCWSYPEQVWRGKNWMTFQLAGFLLNKRSSCRTTARPDYTPEAGRRARQADDERQNRSPSPKCELQSPVCLVSQQLCRLLAGALCSARFRREDHERDRASARGVQARRIKTQTVQPSADTAAMLFWALLASGQINMRKVEVGRRSPQTPSIDRLTSLPDSVPSKCRRSPHAEFQHIKRRHRPAWNCTVLEWRIATQQRFKVVLYLSGVCQHHVLFRESNHDNRSR